MKKYFYGILASLCLFAVFSCDKPVKEEFRTVNVELKAGGAEVNAAGDEAYNFMNAGVVGYVTDAEDYDTASMTANGNASMSGSFKVKSEATRLWCFTKDAYGQDHNVVVSPKSVKDNPSTAADINGMVFCSYLISLTDAESAVGVIKPLTSAIVLDILDSRENRWSGTKITAVAVQAAAGTPLVGSFPLSVENAGAGPIITSNSTLLFECTSDGFEVGTSASPTSLGAVVLPCSFTGRIIVAGEGFKAIFNISQAFDLQAGYIKHIRLDMADAEIDGANFLPKRLGILGDSISTFKGMIPSDHRTYYPTTNVACADVDKWEKTYWGHLINDYWHCELDVNSAWSGSCVADGDPTVVRTPFVKRCSLFKNPDVIILFGGTNDCQTERQIGLGSFDYTSSLDKLNTYRRFRESYIWVIKTLQANYPKAQLICIVGNHIDGEYGNSVKAIATELGIPCVDFRGDKEVTQYEQLHPNAAGHAHMAKRIYEDTLYLFK